MTATGPTTPEPAPHERRGPHEAPAHQPVGSELHRWVVRVSEELGVDPGAVDVEMLLDLARDAAHGVARPAVPLTSFLVGYAVATSGGDRAALETIVARVTEMTRHWALENGKEPT